MQSLSEERVCAVRWVRVLEVVAIDRWVGGGFARSKNFAPQEGDNSPEHFSSTSIKKTADQHVALMTLCTDEEGVLVELSTRVEVNGDAERGKTWEPLQPHHHEQQPQHHAQWTRGWPEQHVRE